MDNIKEQVRLWNSIGNQDTAVWNKGYNAEADDAERTAAFRAWIKKKDITSTLAFSGHPYIASLATLLNENKKYDSEDDGVNDTMDFIFDMLNSDHSIWFRDRNGKVLYTTQPYISDLKAANFNYDKAKSVLEFIGLNLKSSEEEAWHMPKSVILFTVTVKDKKRLRKVVNYFSDKNRDSSGKRILTDKQLDDLENLYNK